jgi:pyridoxine 5-phosphate synthase
VAGECRLKLGVNIDHIAVLREARRVNSPNLVDALSLVERGGGDQITIHLREDRRHIVDSDVRNILFNSVLPLNLEISISPEIVEIAKRERPHRATLVPENRDEVTTEGGLDLRRNFHRIEKVVKDLKEKDIEVSLFIDPNRESVRMAKDLKVDWIELHTGAFANIFAMLNSNLYLSHHKIGQLEKSRKELQEDLTNEVVRIRESAKLGKELNLRVAGGHGLNYQNIALLKEIDEIEEVNIGQSIVARSVFVGLESAVKEMAELSR